MKKIVSVFMAIVMIVSIVGYIGITGNAADTTETTWEIPDDPLNRNNITDYAKRYPNPYPDSKWSLMHGTNGEFTRMSHYQDGAAYQTESFWSSQADLNGASIHSFYQVATNTDWAVTTWSTNKSGMVHVSTIDDVVDGVKRDIKVRRYKLDLPTGEEMSASADIMVVLRHADNDVYTPVWPSPGVWSWYEITAETDETAENITINDIPFQANDMLLFVVKPHDPEQTKPVAVRFCPKVDLEEKELETGVYPTDFSNWGQHSDTFESPAWAIKSSSNIASISKTKWSWYFGKDGHFSEQCIEHGTGEERYWTPNNERVAGTANIGVYGTTVTDEQWATFRYTAKYTGLAELTTTGNMPIYAKTGTAEMMVLLQDMKTEGYRYHPIYPNVGQWEWKTINGTEDNPTIKKDTRIAQLPMQAGDNLLIVIRPKEGTESTVSFMPTVAVEGTYKVANFPFPDNTVFSDWNTVNAGTPIYSTVTHTSGTTAEVQTATDNNIGWYVQQEENPYAVGTWKEAAYTFTYFDFSTSGFETMETWVASHEETVNIEGSDMNETVWVDAHWKDEEGTVAIQGHQLQSTDKKYAAVAYKAPSDGAIIMLEDMEFVAREGSGELLLLQRRGEKYSVLRGWTAIREMENAKLDPYRGYVKTGDIVYFVWRPLKSEGVEKSILWMNTNNYDTAGVIHCVGSVITDTEPTEWTTLGRTVDADLCKTYFAGRNLKLDEGLIGFNFWAVNTDNMNQDAHVKFDVLNDNGNDQKVEMINGQDITVNDDVYGNTDAAGKTLVCKLPAKEMSDTVIAYLCNGNGNVVDYVETTIKDYGEALIEIAKDDTHPNQATYEPYEDFIYAMLNYGAYAQKYFDYNTDKLANESYSDKDNISTVTNEFFTDTANNKLFSSSVSRPQNTEGITFQGKPQKIALSLKSDTVVKIAFSVTGERENDDLAVEILNANGNVNATLERDDSLSYWVVVMKGIAAADLDTRYQIQVTDKTTNTKMIITCTALAFTRSVIKYDGSTKSHNLAKALYLYNYQANLLLEKDNGTSQ